MTVLQLIEEFDRNLSACGHAQTDREAYLSGKDNEVQLSRQSVLYHSERSAEGNRPMAGSALHGPTDEEDRIARGE